MSRLARVIVVLLALCCPRLAQAADVRLAWDPPTDGVTTGFVIFYGDASHTYSQQIDVGNQTTFTVTGLTSGKPHFFAVRGYDASGNFSDFSAEVVSTLPNMSLDAPGAGASVSQPVVFSGWAVDAGTGGQGTGVDQIGVWACPNVCSGSNATLWGTATYGIARSDIASSYGDVRFTNSGFSLSVSGKSAGSYQIVVYAHSALTGDWDARTIPLTLLGTGSGGGGGTGGGGGGTGGGSGGGSGGGGTQIGAVLALDAPAAGSRAIQPFAIAGWAADGAAANGTGVDLVHVWACPGGCSGANAFFVGQAQYGGLRPDIGAALGNARFSASAFGIVARGWAPGPYQIVVYSRSSASGQWQSASVNVNVEAQPLMFVDTPTEGATVSGSFDVSGWALDTAAVSGSGVDAVHVWAITERPSGTQTLFLGTADRNLSRPDVGQAFGTQFANSGWHLTVTPQSPGEYFVIVYMHSSVSQVWTARTVTIRVGATGGAPDQ